MISIRDHNECLRLIEGASTHFDKKSKISQIYANGVFETMKSVKTYLFEKSIKRMGVSQKDLETLLVKIASNPLSGSVIPGLGGIRKL